MERDWLDWMIAAGRLVVPVCAAVVLSAVALNFALASESGAVRWRQGSRVATASMLGFLAVVYVLIHLRVGEIAVASKGLAAALTVTGALLVIAGCAVNVAGRLNLGRNWANQVTVYEEQTLVRTGAFALVRHPLYASLIWMFLGASLVFQNAAALAATLAVFVPAMRFRAAEEERLLMRRFPEYEAYRKRVGRLVPRPGRGGTP